MLLFKQDEPTLLFCEHSLLANLDNYIDISNKKTTTLSPRKAVTGKRGQIIIQYESSD